ncbi:MAG: SGNH/GDSL hydrolase family protein [Gracilimonas sp.]|uniref:SGNH/GDSL hydrolase family protein n=1 Tax=Gracilimonas sp. TaxID=1974203 RepID=UPI0019C1847E|nr:SGNH/GDSL hydrolase family protein [Gracilimonas sp.]MBD3615181.1 SGNH/GDSL hydrolase family protein [Gracilimonas sp.]
MKLLNHSTLLLIQITVLFFFSANCSSEIKPPDLSENEPVTYLALGDSYTIGTGIDTTESWPIQLSEALQDKGLSVKETKIIATNGWTTTDLKSGIAETAPDSSFDLVSLLIGVNNQYQGLDIELYRTEFRELLDQSIAFARGDTSQVFVVSIPNYGVTPFGQYRNPEVVGEEIAFYNKIAKNISNEYGISFVNITPISEEAEDDDSLLASDQLHPSAKMYAMWIEEMLPTVIKIIQE